MYYNQGRKQKKPILRYRKFNMVLHQMSEIVLYEHSVAYFRTYTFCDIGTFVTSVRIPVNQFWYFVNQSTWNLFN